MGEELVISAEDFKKRLDEDKVEFIFDLRNEDEFSEWRIEGRRDIDTLNVPQIDFVGEEGKYLRALPRDRQIVAICAHGDSSRYTAELLRARGFDAVSLRGGMDVWSEFYEVRKVNSSPGIYQIYRAARGCLCHLLVSDGRAVVVDACRHTDRIIGLADDLGAKISSVLDTHLHADHVSGGREVADRTGAAYFIHPDDAPDVKFDYTALKDGQVIRFGKSSIEVIHSPGHTPGSTSFFLDKKFLFSGDTIMKKSIGRPDLGGQAEAWAELLYVTLFSRLAALSDDVTVFPSHSASIKEQDPDGPVVLKLGEARKERKLFRLRDVESFVSFVKANLPQNPEWYQQIRMVNLGEMEADEAKKKELEIGKNLCGMAKK